MNMRNTHMGTQPFPNVNLGGGLTPSLLNDAYQYGQFFIPAGAGTPTTAFPAPPEILSSTNGHFAWTVGRAINGQKAGGCFSWAFKSDFVGAPKLNMKLKVAPIFVTEISADAPNNIIEWSIGAVNVGMGVDIKNLPANTETQLLSVVQPTSTPALDMLLNGGDQTSKENVPLTIVNLDGGGAIGTPISSTNWNFLTINLEREAEDGVRVLDTFQGDVLYLGLGVQFAVDFNNVSQWPE